MSTTIQNINRVISFRCAFDFYIIAGETKALDFLVLSQSKKGHFAFIKNLC